MVVAPDWNHKEKKEDKQMKRENWNNQHKILLAIYPEEGSRCSFYVVEEELPLGEKESGKEEEFRGEEETNEVEESGDERDPCGKERPPRGRNLVRMMNADMKEQKTKRRQKKKSWESDEMPWH